MYVEPRGVGIITVASVADTAEEPTECVEDDSETDENIEIIEIEKRDFDDVARGHRFSYRIKNIC
jgi:hypothetical protein